MKRARPVVTNPARPADMYALTGERIIEFWDDEAQAGGLISFMRRTKRDGRTVLQVSIYRTDAGVEIIKTANSAVREQRANRAERAS